MNWPIKSCTSPRNIGNPYIRLCIQNSEDLMDQPVHELNGAHRLDRRHQEVSQRQKVCLCNRPYGARTSHQASCAFQPRNRRKCTNRLRGLFLRNNVAITVKSESLPCHIRTGNQPVSDTNTVAKNDPSKVSTEKPGITKR